MELSVKGAVNEPAQSRLFVFKATVTKFTAGSRLRGLQQITACAQLLVMPAASVHAYARELACMHARQIPPAAQSSFCLAAQACGSVIPLALRDKGSVVSGSFQSVTMGPPAAQDLACTFSLF